MLVPHAKEAKSTATVEKPFTASRLMLHQSDHHLDGGGNGSNLNEKEAVPDAEGPLAVVAVVWPALGVEASPLESAAVGEKKEQHRQCGGDDA